MHTNERDRMEVDLLFVGAGVASLSAAIRLMQGVAEYNARVAESERIDKPSVIVVDKGIEAGSHILSGAIVDPRPFYELFPDLSAEQLPFLSRVKRESWRFLFPGIQAQIPNFCLPNGMRQKGCFLSHQTEIVRWLKDKCKKLGIEVLTEFAATELIQEGGAVRGVRIGDKGLNRDGTPGNSFVPGLDLRAKATVLGEGTNGYLSQQLRADFELDSEFNPQVWGLGVKELIRVPAGRLSPGSVIHTLGYPLDRKTYGGGFVYAYEEDLLGIGLVVGLDYSNPLMDIHKTFLRYKKHPLLRKLIEDGEVLEYGAKTLPEGGYFAIPQLSVPGAVLIGDSAGMVNPMRLKGIHLAVKSALLAADRIVQGLVRDDFSAPQLDYRRDFEDSWAGSEMYSSRNFRQGFKHGLIPGMAKTALQIVSGGRLPAGRLSMEADYKSLLPKSAGHPTPTTRTDSQLYLDLSSDLYKSGTLHREDEPPHCRIIDSEIARKDNREYDSPCTRYCPAQVYEVVQDEDGKFERIRVNSSNCLHCQTCSIKDPFQNIEWSLPEGGEGPRYQKM